MSKQKKKLLQRRAFLNPQEGMAAIQAMIEFSADKTWANVDATLEITDCSRGISLDFNLWNSSDSKRYIQDRRKKVEILRRLVNEFCDKTLDAYKLYEAEMPRIRKAEAEAKKKDSKK